MNLIRVVHERLRKRKIVLLGTFNKYVTQNILTTYPKADVILQEITNQFRIDGELTKFTLPSVMYVICIENVKTSNLLFYLRNVKNYIPLYVKMKVDRNESIVEKANKKLFNVVYAQENIKSFSTKIDEYDDKDIITNCIVALKV